MNHFFALPIPPEVAQALQQVAADWQAILPRGVKVRWEDPANYHLTLNFLGDLPKTLQPRLIKAALPAAAQAQPFVIHVASCGAFPSLRDPGVLWVSMNEKTKTANLSKAIDRRLTEQGFVIEKHSYKPHITLGRCSSVPWPLSEISETPIKVSRAVNIEITVDRFVLLQTLPLQGRRKDVPCRYNIVQTFPFGNPSSSSPVGAKEKHSGSQ